MENCITLKIDENLNFLVEETKKGIVSYKSIEPDTLIGMVKRAATPPKVTSDVLPENCISFSGTICKKRLVIIDFDAGNIDKIYENTNYEAFPIPRMAFAFILDKEGKIIDVYTAVLERGKITPKTKIYKYPFSNVKEHHLCLGSNAMPEIKSLHQLGSIPYYIFAMPDNNDRYVGANTKLKMEYRNLLSHLKDKTPNYYYTDVLIESGETLSDFISMCNKNL